jgi:hypothetical protein
MIEDKGAWEVVDRAVGLKALRCLWVFGRKLDGRYKAQLVVNGSQQIDMLFKDISSTVAHKDIIRLLLAIINKLNLHAHSIDVKSAFLNGVLNHNVYVHPPDGASLPSNKLLRLRKSLYGLRKAPPSSGARNSTPGFTLSASPLPSLTTASTAESGTEPSSSSPSMSTTKSSPPPISPSSSHSRRRSTRSTGSPTTENSAISSVCASLEAVQLESSGSPRPPSSRTSSNPSAYPTATLSKPPSLPSSSSAHPLPRIIYLPRTSLSLKSLAPFSCLPLPLSRSDIAHAASLLSRALSNWNREHWQAAKGCLRYLRGTSDLALTYDASGDDSILEAFYNADWAGCKDTYRSTTGYIVKTYGGTVSWKSVRQATVAKSTTEAEFMASSM